MSGAATDGTPAPVRVLLADDQTLVRQGIRSLLDLADGVAVVGEADDGRATVDAVATCAPDVVLLDLRMPGRDGIWALETLRAAGDRTPVLVLTTFDDDELVLRALRAGAQGYLLKDVTLEQLTQAVRTLATGGTFVQPSVTARLIRTTGAGAPPGPTRRDGAGPGAGGVPSPELTGRELEVLRLMAQGCSNREIAQVLHLAEGTVKNHVSSVLVKLGTRDRTRAVLRALEIGLFT